MIRLVVLVVMVIFLVVFGGFGCGSDLIVRNKDEFIIKK